MCDWNAELFNGLKAAVSQDAPDTARSKGRAARIETNLDPDKPLADEKQRSEQWVTLSASPPAPAAYEAVLAGLWQDVGCAKEGAPYVVAALLKRLVEGRESPFNADGPHPARIAAALLSDKCEGARGLSNSDVAALRVIAANAPPTDAARSTR